MRIRKRNMGSSVGLTIVVFLRDIIRIVRVVLDFQQRRPSRSNIIHSHDGEISFGLLIRIIRIDACTVSNRSTVL